MFSTQAVKAYPDAHSVLSSRMATASGLWRMMVNGEPPWLNKDDNIKTIRFGNFIATTAAKLATLDIGVELSGSARATWLQNQFNEVVLPVFRDKVQCALQSSGIIIKPTGDSLNYVEDKDFLITDYNSNGLVTGVIFRDVRKLNNKVYTRYEWQYIEKDGSYIILNKAFKSNNENEEGKEVPLSAIDAWKELTPFQRIVRANEEPFEKPLFAYIRNPAANNIDMEAPYGVAIFAEAVTELEGLDIAWSRNDSEVEDSTHMTFVSESAIIFDKEQNSGKRTLPRYVRGIELGINADETVHEHVATMLTEQRWKDINNRLSVIGTKCGFSQGAFGIDKQTGMVTATQVEADDRDTIQTIKDIRDAIKNGLDGLFYALNIIADLYGYAPTGKYEVTYKFGDITYNYDEDRLNWWNYVIQGKMPAWKFFEKFEGMSKEEYEALQADIPQPKQLFNDEE